MGNGPPAFSAAVLLGPAFPPPPNRSPPPSVTPSPPQAAPTWRCFVRPSLWMRNKPRGLLPVAWALLGTPPPPGAGPSLVQIPGVGGGGHGQLLTREGATPCLEKDGPALVWVEGQASVFPTPLPGRPCFQNLFLPGTSACLSHILATWPSPSAHHLVINPCPAVSRTPPSSACSVPIRSGLLSIQHLPWPPQGSLCLHSSPWGHSSTRNPGGRVPPPRLPTARMTSRILHLAPRAPLKPASAPLHLHPASGDPARELSPPAPRGSFWIVPGPSHTLFP